MRTIKNEQQVQDFMQGWLKSEIRFESYDSEIHKTTYGEFIRHIIESPLYLQAIKLLKEQDTDANEGIPSYMLEQYFTINFGYIIIPKEEVYPGSLKIYNQMFSARFVLTCIDFVEKGSIVGVITVKNPQQTNNPGCLQLLVALLFILFGVYTVPW